MPMPAWIEVQQEPGIVRIETDRLQAEIRPVAEYVSGVRAGTFTDKQTGARELGFGLDIVDFLLETDPLPEGEHPPGHRYELSRAYHGDIPKSYVELPQICTQARRLNHGVDRGPNHVVVRQWWQYTDATAGYRPGSRWEQTLVFLPGRRYFFAADRIESVNHVGDLFLRVDMPGHLKHHRGDTFSQVYLSTQGLLPHTAFHEDFPPDERFFYHRGREAIPERMIRAYQVRTPDGSNPWLAALNLNPRLVSEAWCHQRGYVCFIEEFGRLPLNAGDQFSFANVIGFFDSVEEMQAVYDEYWGYTSVVGNDRLWALTEGVGVLDPAGEIHIFPQGLGPDKMTEGGWTKAAQHRDWQLEHVQAAGVDAADRVAGEVSLWLEGQGETAAIWDADGDTKDLDYYDRLKFHVKCEPAVAWQRAEVVLRDRTGAEHRYAFDVAPDRAWREVTIDLNQPTRRRGAFTRERTNFVRFEWAAEEKYRVWLDNLRLESEEQRRGYRQRVFP